MPQDRLRVAVVVASIRSSRFGPLIADWFLSQAEPRADLAIDVIDAADSVIEDLPGFAARIDAADAFVIVVPEYNHSFPGPLKIAIDSANREWHAKPVAFVSYGGISGGLRAIEQLRLVFAELHTVTLRDTVSFHRTEQQFDVAGQPRDPEAVNAAAKTLLDQLTWWGRAMRAARTQHPYRT